MEQCLGMQFLFELELAKVARFDMDGRVSNVSLKIDKRV
jgi:hypothetical protein